MPPLYFDTCSGEVRDAPEIAPHERLNSEQFLHLGRLIVSPDFPFERGDYPLVPQSSWDIDKVLELGKLFVHELAELEPPASLTNPVINNLYVLGLMPHRLYFSASAGRFDGISDFRKQIDAHDKLPMIREPNRNEEYQALSISEITDLILSRYNDLVELPDEAVYDGPITTTIITQLNRMFLAPSTKFIIKQFGGLRKLNEHLGFPDIYSWDDYDFIEYGANVLRHNGVDALTAANIGKLSVRKLGPQYRTIHVRFGWSRFKDLANEEYQNQLSIEHNHEVAVTNYYANNVGYDGDDVSFSEKAQHRALWLLVGHYKPQRKIELPTRLKKRTIEKTIKAIQEQNELLTLGDIEATAVTLNIFDDLWPTTPTVRLPLLDTP